jgi:hypothetical protein
MVSGVTRILPVVHKTRLVRDFSTRTRIFSYTLNTPKKFFLMFTCSSQSANTNFFYSVYPYWWLAYLTHISGSVCNSGCTAFVCTLCQTKEIFCLHILSHDDSECTNKGFPLFRKVYRQRLYTCYCKPWSQGILVAIFTKTR